MVNSVSQVPKATTTSIFYINDIHGRASNMEKITSASKDFDEFVPQNIDKLKLSSGDTMLGHDEKLNKAANKFLNINKIMATAIGNHELDIDPDKFLEITGSATYKLMGANTNIDEKSKLKNKVVNSFIQEQNGNKYGIIGLMPPDLFTRIKNKEKLKGFEVQDIKATVPQVQQEVDSLKKQGVNKIIVISHTGYANEVKLAKEVEGIDVILGGHSHDLITGIEEGKNLFYSKKTGDPTIITQAGRDGNYFGILNLDFDKDGVITKAQNNVTETKNFRKDTGIQYIFDQIMGKSNYVGKIASAEPMPKNFLLTENPNASFLADSIRSELNVDIGMVNAANLRGVFEAGDVYSRDISGITPFKNKMTIIHLNEKEIVDTLKHGAKSFLKSDGKPGLMQVSGLRYSVNKKGDLLDLKYIDKNGNESVIDINNPNIFKKYSVGIDDFCSKGKDGFTMLNKYDEPDTVKYEFDKDDLAMAYIKKQKEPIEIKRDGRINIVD